MGMNQNLAWLHGHKDLAPTPDNIGPGDVLKVPPPNNNPYFNGMKDNVNGFVTLQAAEQVRDMAQRHGNQRQKVWAKTVLPFKFAIQAAQNQPELGLSDADKFSNEENCQFARGFLFRFDPSLALEKKAWCPQAFVATTPTGHKLYDQGPVLPGYASLGPSVTPGDLLTLFSAAYDGAA